MTALQRRFHISSERSAELQREARAAYDTLHDTLNREQRKLLLRLIDAETSCRDEENSTLSSPATVWRAASTASCSRSRRTPTRARTSGRRRKRSAESAARKIDYRANGAAGNRRSVRFAVSAPPLG